MAKRILVLTQRGRDDYGPAVSVNDSCVVADNTPLSVALEHFKRTGEYWCPAGWWFMCCSCGGFALEKTAKFYVTADGQRRVCSPACRDNWTAREKIPGVSPASPAETFRGLHCPGAADLDREFDEGLERDRRAARRVKAVKRV